MERVKERAERFKSNVTNEELEASSSLIVAVGFLFLSYGYCSAFEIEGL